MNFKTRCSTFKNNPLSQTYTCPLSMPIKRLLFLGIRLIGWYSSLSILGNLSDWMLECWISNARHFCLPQVHLLIVLTGIPVLWLSVTKSVYIMRYWKGFIFGQCFQILSILMGKEIRKTWPQFGDIDNSAEGTKIKKMIIPSDLCCSNFTVTWLHFINRIVICLLSVIGGVLYSMHNHVAFLCIVLL